MNATVEAWERDRDPDAEAAFADEKGQVNQITAGTVLEYDGWQWAVVSDIATDREEPMFGIVILDELGDEIVGRLEEADGCRQHYKAVEHLRNTGQEYWTPVDYVINDGIWEILGPVHPDSRIDPDSGSDGGPR